MLILLLKGVAVNDATPLLTVIVPVFNTSGELLERCFSSLPFDVEERFESIVVDDGSSEETQERLSAFAALYGAKFTLFRQENMGQSAARRQGVRLAQGAYILFLDSDDYLDARAFTALLDILETDKPDILGFNYEKVDEAGRTIQRFIRFEQPYEIWDKRELICASCSLWCQVYRRGLIIKYLESAPDDLRIGEDLSVAVPVAIAAKSTRGTALNVYRYVQHADSVTHTVDKKNVFDILKAYTHSVEQVDSDLRLGFKEELEWVCILHVLIYGSMRAIWYFGPKRSYYRDILDFVNSLYPAWRDNKYLNAKHYAKASDVRLAMDGHWRSYVIKQRLKDLLSNLRRRA